MNKTLIAGALCAMTVAAALAKGSADPVLMTVNGKDVPLSEFEYLYHKNNSQQLQPQSIDEYVDMFVTYKLKVADAEAAGIDTTAKFIDEFKGYRRDLSTPYLNDKAFADSIAHASYNHTLSNVEVHHLMVPLRDASGNTATQKALIDSLRAAIIAGADFTQLADRYSSDGSVKVNHGNLGYIGAGRFPYEFEDMAWNTPEGEVSPVFTTRFGYHIIKRGPERRSPGEVRVRHILKVTSGLNAADAEAKKAQIDSIYALVSGGADFAEVARAESEDPGSAKNGGELQWFGTGQMVPEFEAVSYELPDGAISKPFATSYGWHIVEKLGSRPPMAFEEREADIRKAMERDVRQTMINRHRTEQCLSRYPAKINKRGQEAAYAVIDECGGLDSLAYTRLQAMTATPLFTLDGTTYTVAQAMAAGKPQTSSSPEVGRRQFDALQTRLAENRAVDAARTHLADDNADYRNLLNEYRDGMLLFEISNRNVWERATTDSLGLENYFRANRANYKWQKPHYKGVVVMCTSDSIAQIAREWLAENHPAAADLAAELRKRFGNDVRAERVVTAKGDNVIVDYVAFDGRRPSLGGKNNRWAAWFAYDGRVIEQPEEASDVRGAVSTDYQQVLEKDWVNELHEKYPVKINPKVLKKVK